MPITSKTKPPSSHFKQDDLLRRNSQKYDDLMKQRRDELRRKRGALELNSDLELDDNFRVPQEARAELPGGIGASHEVGAFKSKHHN